MEIWGRCASCARWFYCPRSAHSESGWLCPVCGSEPTALENRGGPSHAARVRVSWPLRRPVRLGGSS
jgi:hypothetical protein